MILEFNFFPIHFRRKRTTEDIEELLILANIKSSEVAPIVQTLHSSVPLDKGSSNFKVLELDEHLLNSLKVGDRFVKFLITLNINNIRIIIFIKFLKM